MVYMKRILNTWIEEQVQRRIHLSMMSIQFKILSLHNFLRKRDLIVEDFISSNDCFTRFEQRAQLHYVALSGESARSDIEGFEALKVTFAKIVEESAHFNRCLTLTKLIYLGSLCKREAS